MSTSPIDKSRRDNTDLLQIEYLSELPISKREVIVVESNDTIAITIHKFLLEMGCENIYVCKNLNECLTVFSDLISNEINVPVVIDDNISNNIDNGIRNILEIQPDAKIVIVTSKEKTDPQVAKLIDIGITSITVKPLDFHNFKNSFSTVFGNQENTEPYMKRKFENILASHDKINHKKIMDVLRCSEEQTESIIRDAITMQKITPHKEVLEAECNQCSSTNMIYTSECPKCEGINFKQSYLIEHYSCGEVYPKTEHAVCPKCNKDIGSVGTDYREFAEYYICSSCSDRFPRPKFRFTCLECGNMFDDKLASWKKNKIYKVQK